MDTNRRKIVVVGDSSAGKTALILAFTTGNVVNDLTSHTMGHGEVHIEVDQEPMCIFLWDASYRCDTDFLGSLRYHNADGSIICFSIAEPESLDNVREKWMPELAHFMPKNSPVILVGCKSDLRDDATTTESLRQRGESTVTHEQGVAMAELIHARMYFECSALTGEGIRELFLHAAQSVKRVEDSNRLRWRGGCVIA